MNSKERIRALPSKISVMENTKVCANDVGSIYIVVNMSRV